MASDFKIPEDVANRALQHIGAERIVAFTDGSKAAQETSFCYNKLRQAELRRNNWKFSIKRAIVRPLDIDTLFWTPPTWDAVTTFQIGQAVSYTDTFGNVNVWICQIVNNLNNIPGAVSGVLAPWTLYAGNMYAHPYDTTGGTSYYSGDLVYEQTAFNTFNIFMALTSVITGDPAVTQAWSATQTYRLGAIVSVGAQNYVSLAIENLNQNPVTATTYWATTGLTGSYQWTLMNGTLQQLAFLYPLGVGPVSQTFTKNIFPLPANYLNIAVQSPRDGAVSILGAPTNPSYQDWEFEGNNFIVTRFAEPMFIRFLADVTDVTVFDAMFAEGLACRIATEVCEIITQSTEKLVNVSKVYSKSMGEARILNAIEIGPVEPPVDDYISTRL